jgi:PAS domain S-box-containing protein
MEVCTGTMCDTTGNKRSEKALPEEERRFRAIFDHTLQFMGLLTPGGDVLEVNRAALLFIKAREEDVAGRKFWLTPWWSHSRKLINTLRDAVREAARGRLVRFEATHISSEGDPHYFDFSLKPVPGKNGKVIFLIAEGRDITERREAETLLRESEARYRTAIEKSNDGVAIVKDGLHLYVNDRFLRMFGYEDAAEITGQPIMMVVHPDDRKTVKGYHRGRSDGGRSPSRYEFKGIRKDGTAICVEVSVSAIRYLGSPALLSYLRDITDRKVAEEALRRREEELQFKTRNLEEANIALKALARHIEENRQELERNIVLNLRTLVFPYIEKVQKSNLSVRQKMFMEITEKNLNDVISPFLRAIGHFGLTPTEMHIAGLIRDGRKTKEIAESLHISRRAVEVHRYNIRKKLKINRNRHNLCAFLRSLGS